MLNAFTLSQILSRCRKILWFGTRGNCFGLIHAKAFTPSRVAITNHCFARFHESLLCNDSRESA